MNNNENASPHKGMARELGIYIHIPFCVRKCRYCDFLSMPAGEEMIDRYVKALCNEIRGFAQADRYQPVSVFLGGGTPSILKGEQIAAILEAVRDRFGRLGPEVEITMECNPGTLDKEKLGRMREAGINRLSIGLQSADNAELKLLGRIHTWEMFCENYAAAREAGFSNINIDLMSALPGQTVESWKRTLKQVLALRPEHISAYSLIIEEGTPFYAQYHKEDELRQEGKVVPGRLLPTEEEERLMYEETARILSEAGMERYEISNYAMPGYESIHNCGYWERREYIGFGLGASSCLEDVRFANTSNLECYLEGNREAVAGTGSKTAADTGLKTNVNAGLEVDARLETTAGPNLKTGISQETTVGADREDRTILTREDVISETMFLGLRMTKGVDLEAFASRFGVRAEELFEEPIRKYERMGLLEIRDGRLRLTRAGMFVSNPIMAQFLLE